MSLDWSISEFSTLDFGTKRVTGRGVMAANWEGLRKQARALENDVDTKLVTLSKLGTNYTRGTEDKQPLLGGGQETEIEALQSEIEGLLTKLGGINDQMAGFASG